MEKIKVAVVGLRRGSTFLKLFGKDFSETTVVAVCDGDEERIEQLRKEELITPEIAVYDDYDKMLDEQEIDAVMLANFFHEHASYAIKAMNKGIAVLSETTAAPSLGDCVDLVEAQERTNAKYMLAANCLYFPGLHAMKEKVESGKYGELFTGYAEYFHGSDALENPVIDLEADTHWRKFLPASYYNMHSLGPLMYVTGTVPVKVSCKAVHKPEFTKARAKVEDTPTAMVITEMDNGAVFSTTGCSNQRPATKWYRLSFSGGNLETVRYDGGQFNLVEANAKEETFSTTKYNWVSAGVIDGENYVKGTAENSGHGGIDYFVAYYFIQYMLGKHEPFLNIYRSVALSAAGIIGWYSALSDGQEYRIPDFSKKEDRDKVRGDYRMPFAKRYADLTLPCRLQDKDQFTGFDFK